MNPQGNILKSVDKVFKIVEHLKVNGGKTVTELSQELDMPKSTVQVYLNTLSKNKFVVKNGSKYQIGLQFLQYGMYALWSEPVFPNVKSKVEELADSTGELAACFVEEMGDAVYVYGTEGDRAVRTDLTMGDRSDLHCTASGKAIFAHLPEERIEEILSSDPLERKTAQTITDPDELRDELRRIRERGHAYSREESIEGMRSVAAPIMLDDEVVCSISLAGPANRFVGERFTEEVPDIVKGAANEIELKLTYSESGL
ncbi:IclR family transcriptional regulator [Halobellus marinus]|uniref:IclR family transcriptional regulator n=1 Tax=Halobellus TaxID=1073986 RepID=UPI0028AEAF2B|nr:IclR family transcriptional regulator [Halobellus sp. DFY28]